MEDIMNRITKQCIAFTIGFIAFIFALGYAGSFEYADEVCYNMPEQVYEAIVKKLGEDASQKDIAAEYMENRNYYNNLKSW